ncbi:T9SS type A sorting domain-containing protein [uncultured Aquimarina sp.]|uniref:T9SS type A sorting domain-containing protein n=1 Tax=uncultured Aquimarina sp. TaxID=575652 RepID=UPI00263970D1|nr:T9SS type A sorting domain-containing protein [uncultured Aquimarina sp.]
MNRIVIFLLILLKPIYTFSQVTTYEDRNFINYNEDYYHKEAANINGDIFPDFVLAPQYRYQGCTTEKNIALIVNNGDGSFSPLKKIEKLLNESNTIDYNVSDLKTIDYNFDTYSDILYSINYKLSNNSWISKIKLIENNGDGTFKPSITLFEYETGVINEFISFDVDNDSDIDIFFPKQGRLYHLKNIGNSVFNLIEYKHSGFARSSELSQKDIDNDGFIDLIAKSEGKIRLIKNKNGVIESNNEVIIDYFLPNSLHMEMFSLIDFNNDNYVDLVSLYKESNSNSSSLHVYLNSKTDDFNSILSEKVLIKEADGIKKFLPVDLDNDLDIDIIYSNSSNVFKLVNNMNNDYETSYLLEDVIYGACGFDPISVSDINVDGYQDIILSFENDQCTLNPINPAWYKNDGFGNFSFNNFLHSGNSLKIKTLDIDSDGDLDVVSASNNYWYSSLLYYENIGNGEFSSVKLLSDTARNFEDYEIGDIDNDSENEIIMFADDKIFWKELNSTQINEIATFGARNYSKLFVYDFNNDNKVDIFYSNEAHYNILINNGGNDFTTRNLSSSINSGRSVVVGLLNEDNLPDIVVNGSIYINNGDFSFSKVFTPDSFNTNLVNGINIIDYEGDLDNDILFSTTSNSGTEIFIIENLGSDNFSKKLLKESSNFITNEVYFYDLDSNGWVDNIYTTSRSGSSNSIRFEYNNENTYSEKETFYRESLSNCDQYGFKILYEDLNGDQNSDLIVSYSRELYWINNLKGVLSNEDVEYPNESYKTPVFNLYPNPILEVMKIEPLNYSTNYNIKIIDALGNEVFSKNNNFDITEIKPILASGFYFVKIIHSNNKQTIIRLIKQ